MGTVALIQMPFALAYSPSIGLTSLKGGLEREGISAEISYFNLRFAARIGVGRYFQLSEKNPHGVLNQVGEWIFSGAVFDQSEDDVKAYVERVLRSPPRTMQPLSYPASEAFIRTVLEVRAEVDRFLDGCAAAILAQSPRIVGFSSMFQQHLAAIALAKRVKAARPETAVVVGGANCDGHLGGETLRRFPWIDAVVSGEGEVVFPEVVRRLLAQRPLAGLHGVHSRAASPTSFAPRVMDLDDLPALDYDDYFRQLEEYAVQLPYPPVVLLETARGCWWGEKHHCIFCSMNGSRMKSRIKSPPRIVEELTLTAQRYPGRTVLMADQILSMSYFAELLPKLASIRLGVNLIWHTRPSLKREQVATLRDAGVRWITPGIESLSDPILHQMRKRVTVAQNIQLLKWCEELGVRVSWNILWGFPGERPEEYARMAEIVPLLTHLEPPAAWGQIGVGPFSPLFREQASFELADVAPAPAYGHIYPFDSNGLAQFFVYNYRTPKDVEGYTRALADELTRWRDVHPRSKLAAVDRRGGLVIHDQRPAAREERTVLSGVERTLYLACDRARSAAALQAIVGESCSMEQLRGLLRPLLERGLMLELRDRFLSLAVVVPRSTGAGVRRLEWSERHEQPRTLVTDAISNDNAC